jgi:hypothetical protein
MHRIALAMARAPGYDKTSLRDKSGKSAPRSHVFDEAFSPNWDDMILNSGHLSRVVPRSWQLSREIQRRHAEYDAVVTWGEKLSLAMLMSQQLTSIKKPHIAMMYQFEKPNIRVPLSAFKKNLHAVVTWSSVQRRALIEKIGFPPERVYLIRHYVDQVFYSPTFAEEDIDLRSRSGNARLCDPQRGGSGNGP